ncbi:MAG TPA: hypothetical protein PK733_08380 [Clostridiales bacterium]|nr:hypothetical protein [Clostridiales bacterium]
MIEVKDMIKNNKGSATAHVIALLGLIIFIILPLFAVVMERYILYNKVNIIKDAVDVANLASYNAISTEDAAKNDAAIRLNSEITIYKNILAKNLKLKADMTPEGNSIAEGEVVIDELKAYLHINTTFPITCSQGNSITRPTMHSVIKVPIKPMLFRRVILSAIGKDVIYIKVHVDTELPINN